MIGQPQGHRWRAVVIATRAIPTRQPQGLMSPMEGVIEELQAHEPIPGGIPFGEGVRLASKGIEPIAQGAVESFDMHRASCLHPPPQRGADLHRQQPPMFIAMLDRLRQRHCRRDHPCRASALACELPLSIGSHEDALVALPAITEPVQLALVGPLDSGSHCSLDQLLAQGTAGAGDHEATVSILH